MKLFTLSKAFLVQAQDASREELDRNRRLYRELRDENVVRLIKEYEDRENLPDSMRLVHTRKDADGESTLFVSVPAQAVNYSFNWRDRDAFMDNRLAEVRNPKVEQDVEVKHGIAAYVEAHAADGRAVAKAEYER